MDLICTFPSPGLTMNPGETLCFMESFSGRNLSSLGSSMNMDDCEEEDLFEQAFVISEALKQKLKDLEVLDKVSGDLDQLASILGSLETKMRERDEDSKRLFRSFRSTKETATKTEENLKKEQETISLDEYTESDIEKIKRMQNLWRKTRGSPKGSLYDVVLYYRSHPDKDAKNRIQRHKVTQEIIKSEKSYVKQLSLFINRYMIPLDEQLREAKKSGVECKIATKEQRNDIFMNVTAIAGFNEELLKNLIEAYHNWPKKPLEISKLFHKMLPYFKAYSLYIIGYQKHLTTLLELKKNNPFFVDWLKEIQNSDKELNPNGDITDLSITPIQRIPRYVLLLKELLNCTPEDDPDRENLIATIAETKELADYINESKRINENLQVAFKIQELIAGADVPNLLEPHRYFLHEGPILTLTDRIRRRHLYIFNDLLILTRKSWKFGSDEQVFDTYIPLKGASIRDDIEVPYSFRICYGNSKFMCFVCEDDIDKSTWMRDISNALADTVSQQASHNSDTDEDIPLSEDFPMAPNKQVSKQGYLSKMEGGFYKTWKQKWIQVSAGILYSFDAHTDTVPATSYHLHVSFFLATFFFYYNLFFY